MADQRMVILFDGFCPTLGKSPKPIWVSLNYNSGVIWFFLIIWVSAWTAEGHRALGLLCNTVSHSGRCSWGKPAYVSNLCPSDSASVLSIFSLEGRNPFHFPPFVIMDALFWRVLVSPVHHLLLPVACENVYALQGHTETGTFLLTFWMCMLNVCTRTYRSGVILSSWFVKHRVTTET